METVIINPKCKVECSLKETCVQLPTLVHPNENDKVSTIFIGQGGGSTERRENKPFVGRSGQRLRKQIHHCLHDVIKYASEDSILPGYAFGNITRDCPKDHKPKSQDIKVCSETYLFPTIETLKTHCGLKSVVALGKKAACAFFSKTDIAKLHLGDINKLHHPVLDIPIYVTYHPSYIMTQCRDFNNDPKEVVVINAFLQAFLEN
jgi:uracil-DNA glycosylase family 4